MTYQNDLESEIFALVETTINLQKKYQNGDITDTFFMIYYLLDLLFRPFYSRYKLRH